MRYEDTRFNYAHLKKNIKYSSKFFIPSDSSNYKLELPKDIFKVDGELVEEMLEVGNFLPMTDDRGNRLQGQIIEVGEDFVRMDFNHPLADKEMFFSGSILSIREATQSELEHGHVHGEGGVQH